MLKQNTSAFLEQGVSFWKCHDKKLRKFVLFLASILPSCVLHTPICCLQSQPRGSFSTSENPFCSGFSTTLPPSDFAASLAGPTTPTEQQQMPPLHVSPSCTHATLRDQLHRALEAEHLAVQRGGSAGQREGLCLTRLELATLVSSSGIGR